MSWFVDLAGRAEELLNRVDQSAAVVLKKDELDSESDYSQATATIAGPQTVSIVNLVPPPPPTPSRIGHQAAPLSASRSVVPSDGTTPSVSAAAGKGKSRKQIEEEKLFEFLNSDGATSAGSGERRQVKVSDNVSRKLKGTIDSTSPSSGNADQLIASSNVSRAVVGGSRPDVVSETPVVDVIESKTNVSVPREQRPTSQGPVSSLEYENRLLHNEVNSLNRELSQMLQRSKNAELEQLGLRTQLETRTKELSAGNQSALNFQERENDLKQALDAKDSQLAVLRVRLQEADQELNVKRPLVEQLQQERRRLLEDSSSSSGVHTQAIESVQERLRQTEEALERERSNFRNVQAESSQRILKLENELKMIGGSYGEVQGRLTLQKSTVSELAAQLKTAKHGMECSQQELADYKTKAQRILQSKERLISSLKQSSGPNGSVTDNAHAVVSAVELEELRQERDLLKDEVNLANQQLTNLREEMQEGDRALQEEIDSIREHGRGIGEQLRESEQRRQELELEASQISEELRYLREDSSRQRTTLQSRLQDRDEEIERLRRQLIAKQVNSSSSGELESRLNALTESLIQKQTLLEALATEKSSLVFQLERAERRANEKSTPSRRAASLAVNVSDDNEAGSKQRVPSFMVENVFDSGVTRKVKRVYNTIDSLSIRLGVFLRRYPMARTLILIYMAMLHLWVMIVLFTYTPEVHGRGEKPTGK